MGFDHDELVLINKSLLYYKGILQKSFQVDCIKSNVNVEQENLILLNQLLEKLAIELCEESEDNICNDCHNHICEKEDIFIDSYSFKIDKPIVVCSNCYENKYKDLYKDL
jgi:hypothetical protein